MSLETRPENAGAGFSDDLRLLLSRLNRKHKAQATVLYKEIVRKLSDVDLVEDWSASKFSAELS